MQLGSIPVWIVPLICFCVFWISLTAGMAWEKYRGLWFDFGKLRLDKDLTLTLNGNSTLVDLFFIEVKNGDLPSKPRVRISDMSGGIPWIEHGYDAHWRGRPSRILKPREPQQFGLLVATSALTGKPALFTWSMDDEFHRISKDVPLNQQGIIILEVTIDCESVPDKEGKVELSKSQQSVFLIVPDTSTNAAQGGYKIEEPPSKKSEFVKLYGQYSSYRSI
jgi:hypothetical protein